ncbi:MAG: InlB B-repeat-containing protein, partial [Clostridia bacterium]|nr:InlB B-repeat-containing protein [Clostridia bacterium]
AVTLATPTRDGYNFLGWTYEDKAVATDKWSIADNVTLVATWQEIVKYTVSFVQEGQETVSLKVEQGKGVTADDIPDLVQKTGYTVAWDKALPESITESITLTAVYTANTYKITYDANGGSVTPASEDVTYDSAVTLATPTRDGCNFIGWTYEGKVVATDKWSIADNVTLVANWQEIEKFTVSFVQAGEELKTIEVYEGGSVSAEDIPALVGKTGYTVAWDKDLPESITESITLTAVYTANTYKVTYDANGGSVTPASEDVAYDGAVTLATPTRDGYNFIGWTYEGKVVSTDKWSIADNVTLVANWQEIVKYTVSFVQEGQETVSLKVEQGKGVSADDIPALVGKTGYSVAWDKALPETITEDVTLTAVYTANTYTITYDANGGSVTPASEEVTYDSAVTLATPTRDGYNFLGWTYEGKVVSTDKWSIADNVTLVADWQEIVIVKYTVSFVQEGCETINIEVKEGASLAEADMPKPQSKTGYIVAWENKDLTNIQGNITVNAVETVKKYTVVLNANGGTASVSSFEIKYGATYELPTPTNGSKTFKGWKYNGTVVDLKGTWNIDGADTITLIAEWINNADDNNWTNNY